MQAVRLSTAVWGRRTAVLAVAAVFQAMPAASQALEGRDRLAELSIEELSEIQITSVSRRAERLSDAAASVFVITSEDIRRSGATSLPEALRLAPNLQVARVDAGAYAISARGFNNAIGNKLLVLIDGRTVYTPQFSGVNWDSQAVMLEDVERIEIISGPGATLWGANAVNGVINVITRSSERTQGTLASAGLGDRGTLLSARHGGRLGEGGSYRVYGLATERQNSTLFTGASVIDGRRDGQMGFRADWSEAGRSLRLQGDAYEGRTDPGPLGPVKIAGANLLARLERELSATSQFYVQAYYDQVERDDPFSLRDEIQTFDIEAQHGFTLGRHRLLWGGGYRHARDFTRTHFNPLNPLPQIYNPAERSLKWSNLFVQDEIALGERLTLTLGLKAEKNVYTGVEWLPDARLAWKPDDHHLLWGSLSRAVRAPARIDREFQFLIQLPPLPLFPLIAGGPDFRSEIADVAQIGYRGHPSARFSYSVTLFGSYYDRLRSGQPAVPFVSPALVQNMMQARTWGVEAWGNYQLTPAWRLSAGMMQLREHFWFQPGSTDPDGPSDAANDPKHQWLLRSQYNINEDMDLDIALRHVGELPNPQVPAYTAVDARFAWRPGKGLEASVTAQNLFDDRHVEFGAAGTARQIERAVFLRLLWRG